MLSSRVSAVLLCTLAFVSYVAAYTVVGNQIHDPNGKAVLLRGVDRPSFEWSATGQFASASDYQLMASWGANVVRITSNQDFWLSGAATHSSGYKGVIDQQIQWIKAAGMGVILDLHWSDMGNLQISVANQQLMADANSITFWTEVANIYKTDPWVMFELYNEPNGVSWDVWRNGGATGAGWNAVGMQQMYNAVRATGAENVCIIGGLNYAFDLSGIVGYSITGTNIAYATHPYDYPGKQKGDWQAAFGYLAATYPIIMTEFGQYCNSDTYVSDLLSYAQGLNIHWTAWAWWVGDCSFPSIITDWSGTPSAVGQTVKTYLAMHSTPAPGSGSSGTSGSPTNAPSSPPTQTPTKSGSNTGSSPTNAPTHVPTSSANAPTKSPTSAPPSTVTYNASVVLNGTCSSFSSSKIEAGLQSSLGSSATFGITCVDLSSSTRSTSSKFAVTALITVPASSSLTTTQIQTAMTQVCQQANYQVVSSNVAAVTAPTNAPSTCSIGAEGCACTVGGTCDKGLSCLSQLCVDYNGLVRASGASPVAQAGALFAAVLFSIAALL